MQEDHDTRLGWWTEKPDRLDRGSSFAPLPPRSEERDERVWTRVAVIIMIMTVFGLSLLRLVGAIV
ncbi:hypothetical protein QTI17_01660 [Variovorax sp. J31P179]|uniref:hypothetical protein n=1 Tax=Variovorax sp. J31P179 TaxID=3053508 RepID=UPI002576BD1F|nr:hypothetical protein [Variovorax sp. J31P179]MDM0079288.1 hypothetical protein [Variovorax sp. J31P179]